MEDLVVICWTRWKFAPEIHGRMISTVVAQIWCQVGDVCHHVWWCLSTWWRCLSPHHVWWCFLVSTVHGFKRYCHCANDWYGLLLSSWFFLNLNDLFGYAICLIMTSMFAFLVYSSRYFHVCDSHPTSSHVAFARLLALNQKLVDGTWLEFL